MTENPSYEQLLHRVKQLEKEAAKRRNAERALKESEEFLNAIIENIPDMLFVKDAKNLRFLRFNKAGEALLGHSRETLLGKTDYDFFPPAEADFFTEKDKAVLTRGELLDIPEEPIQTRYLGKRILHTKKIPILDERGRPRYLLGISEDITERKRAEEMLRESDRKLSTLMSNLAGMVYRCKNDPAWTMEFISDGCMELTGYSRVDLKESRKISYAQLIHPDDRGKVWQDVQFALKQNEAFQLIYRIKTAQGVEKWVWERGRGIFSEEGQLLALEGFIADISELKRIGEEKKKIELQLQQAQKMEALGTLAGGIAHDFNNILAGVIGFTEIAMNELAKDSSVYESLKKVLKAADRAKDLVMHILAFSRQRQQDLKPVMIKMIVKEALKLIRASFPSTIEICLDLQSEASVMADPTQIHQIVMNLCTNAAHAMREKGGKLAVRLETVNLNAAQIVQYLGVGPGAYIKMSVSDTGHGISAHHLERIFDPFFTTKEKGEGTGLGLSVVHGIVKSHGGNITVYSEPGSGTTFNVLLPALESHSADQAGPVEVVPTGSEHLLFVDDEKSLTEIGKQLLESLGYDVTVKTDSLEALELFQSQPERFDLVITDMTMPKITGLQLARELKKIRPDIPVILCTGFNAMIDENKALAEKVQAFVLKPFLTADLARTIRRVLENR